MPKKTDCTSILSGARRRDILPFQLITIVALSNYQVTHSCDVLYQVSESVLLLSMLL